MPRLRKSTRCGSQRSIASHDPPSYSLSDPRMSLLPAVYLPQLFCCDASSRSFSIFALCTSQPAWVNGHVHVVSVVVGRSGYALSRHVQLEYGSPRDSVMRLDRLARSVKNLGCLAKIGPMEESWSFEQTIEHQLLNAAVLHDLYRP